jgi:hypothetical protein
MKLRFTNLRQPTSIEQLSPLEQTQLAAAGKRYDNVALPAKERLSQERSQEDLDEGVSFYGSLEVWEVEGDKAKRYTAFMYMADSGTIFRYGTTKIEGEVIQCGFEMEDASIEDEIDAAYQAGCKEFAKELKAGPKMSGPVVAYQQAIAEIKQEPAKPAKKATPKKAAMKKATPTKKPAAKASTKPATKQPPKASTKTAAKKMTPKKPASQKPTKLRDKR